MATRFLTATAALTLALGAAWTNPACAQVTESPLQVSGFATLGAVYNDNAEAGAVFSGAQKKPVFQGLSANLDTVAGVQFDYALLKGTSLAIQVVGRAGEEWEPKVRMALARQQINDDLTLRLGRMRSPVFMDSDSIEIGYSNPLIRPPMPIYVALANVAPFQDGLDLQWRTTMGETTFLTSAFYGRGEHDFYRYSESQRVQANILLDGITGMSVSAIFGATTVRLSHTMVKKFTSKSPQIPALNAGIAGIVSGLRTAATSAAGAGFSQVAASLNGEADAINNFYDPYTGSPRYSSVGVTTDIDNWHVVGEWAKLVTNNATGLLSDRSGYAVTVAYNAGRFTPYASISQLKRDNKLRDTSVFAPTGLANYDASAAALDYGIAALKATFDAQGAVVVSAMEGFTLGMRIDLKEKMALKFQYDFLRSPNNMDAGIMIAPKLPYKNEVNLLSASLDIVF